MELLFFMCIFNESPSVVLSEMLKMQDLIKIC